MLKEQLKNDATGALKQGNHEVAGVLRLVLAAISSKEKEKRYKEKLAQEPALSDEEVIAVLSSEIKKRKDAIALYEKGNRPELAEQEKKEIAIFQKYLPEQLSADELKKLVQESIAKVGATQMKDMGKIMADLMPKVKGKADNSEISKIVKELIG